MDFYVFSTWIKCRFEMFGGLNDHLMETQGRAACNRRSEKQNILREISAMWDATQITEQNPYGILIEHQSYEPSEMPEFQVRIKKFTEELLANHDESDTILLVGHHDWIRTWFWLYKGIYVSPENCETLTADI